MWQNDNEYGSQKCNMGNITTTLETYMASMKVIMHPKNEDAASRHSRVIMLTANYLGKIISLSLLVII